MTESQMWFERGGRVIPGGVNSPVRAFGSVGGCPVLVESGQGPTVCTVDGEELVDFCGSWGPLILGHAHPRVIEAIQAAAVRGTSFGMHTRAEVLFAERLCELVPSMDKVRLVSSGTEAVMTAVRLARGATGRRALIKFEGCYHGHSDSVLVAAGSGLLTHGMSSSAGVPAGVTDDVFVVPYNDPAALDAVADMLGDELAAILVEPVAGNMGLVLPDPGFLEGLRGAADRRGALLIFDEVISGFRLGPTSYGQLCGVRPDLTTLGKIIGGGMPIGAVGGRADVMDELAPQGGVYQAGTLSGNPVAVAAGRATLDVLVETSPYDEMERQGQRVEAGLCEAAAHAGVPVVCSRAGGMFTPFFRSDPVKNLADARSCDAGAHAAFFHGMLKRGFYLPPSPFETAFISAVHGDSHIEAFIAAAHDILAE